MRTVREKVLRGWMQRGYPMVVLCDSDGGKFRRTFVHRLVCEAFHGPAPSPAHEVAHSDGDSANPRASNLRWATHVENEADKKRHGTSLIGERHHGAKLTEAQARHIKFSGERPCELARRFGVSPAQVSVIQSGRSWRELEPA